MKNDKFTYEILKIGINDTSEAPIDRDIFYKCNICEGIVNSMPSKSTGCECGNIGIDKDMHRLWVEDYKKIVILKRVSLNK